MLRNKIDFLGKRKIALIISSVLIITSIVSLAVNGLKLGIDFTGGALLEIRYDEFRPSVAEVQNSLSEVELNSLVIQPVGVDGMLLRFQEIGEEKHQEVIIALKVGEEGVEVSFEQMRFEAVGPSIGQ